MPRPRRTEHCWPVAHTLNDLLPLIPDPASFEVGSVLRIERIMLPDVHLQLVKAIADRFCPANGWQTVYLVANKYRAAEVEDGSGNALVLHKNRNSKAIKSVVKEAHEHGHKVVSICEGGLLPNGSEFEIVLPLPVRTTAPINCDKCGRLTFFMHRGEMKLIAVCGTGHPTQRTEVSIESKKWGTVRKIESNRQYCRWTKKRSDEINQLRQRGFTYEEIGRMLNCSWQSVYQLIRQGGYEGKLARQRNRAQMAKVESVMTDLAI